LRGRFVGRFLLKKGLHFCNPLLLRGGRSVSNRRPP